VTSDVITFRDPVVLVMRGQLYGGDQRLQVQHAVGHGGDLEVQPAGAREPGELLHAGAVGAPRAADHQGPVQAQHVAAVQGGRRGHGSYLGDQLGQGRQQPLGLGGAGGGAGAGQQRPVADHHGAVVHEAGVRQVLLDRERHPDQAGERGHVGGVLRRRPRRVDGGPFRVAG
jgi:hypothetical protein